MKKTVMLLVCMGCGGIHGAPLAEIRATLDDGERNGATEIVHACSTECQRVLREAAERAAKDCDCGECNTKVPLSRRGGGNA